MIPWHAEEYASGIDRRRVVIREELNAVHTAMFTCFVRIFTVPAVELS